MNTWTLAVMTAALLGPIPAAPFVQTAPPVPTAPAPTAPIPTETERKAVAARLKNVPLFVLSDEKGNAMTMNREGQRGIIPVWVHPTDAQTAFDTLKKEKPEVAAKLKLSLISLGDIYEYQWVNRENDDRPRFNVIAHADDMASAEALWKLSGKTGEFRGVPLFLVRQSDDKSYPTFRDAQQKEVVPVFFQRIEADLLGDRLRASKEKKGLSFDVEVLPLDTVLVALPQPKMLPIVMVPHPDALAYLRQQQKNAAPARPAGAVGPEVKPAPAKPTPAKPAPAKPAPAKPAPAKPAPAKPGKP